MKASMACCFDDEAAIRARDDRAVLGPGRENEVAAVVFGLGVAILMDGGIRAELGFGERGEEEGLLTELGRGASARPLREDSTAWAGLACLALVNRGDAEGGTHGFVGGVSGLAGVLSGAAAVLGSDGKRLDGGAEASGAGRGGGSGRACTANTLRGGASRGVGISSSSCFSLLSSLSFSPITAASARAQNWSKTARSSSA
jgi:hypothetical protein